MIHIWSVLCKKASIDSQTNSMSLFDVIDKLTIKQNTAQQMPNEVPSEFVMPLEFQLATLISNITKKEIDPEIKISLFNANNELMGETENPLEVPKNAKSMRAVVVFDAIKIKGEGMYTFKVDMRGNKKEKYQEVAKIPLEVEILKNVS
jgi:hypothetical protein